MGRNFRITFPAALAAACLLAACASGGGSTTPTSPGGIIPQFAKTSLRTPRPTATPIPSPSPIPSFDPNAPILTDTNPSTAGVFLGAVCAGGSKISCPDFAATMRHGIALGTVYTGWNADFTKLLKYSGIGNWPQLGITPEFTWQPTANVTFTDINNGVYDAYFTTSANELKAFGSTVFLRPFHEFNGNWYPWGLVNQGGNSDTDAAFIAAWQRMVTIFHNQGATNVKFVWCFSTGGLRNAQIDPWNNPANAYPGDAYVDWIGYDTYNRGNIAGGKWNTFDDVTLTPYQLAVSISPNKPIAVSEIASNEYGDGGGLKGNWIAQMLAELSSPSNPYPHIRLLSWFEPDIRGYTYDSASTSPTWSAFAAGIRTTDQNGVLNFRSNGAVLGNVTTP